MDKMIKVDLRVVTMDIPSQDIITKDNVTLKVNGVVYFRVNNPQKSVIQVENFYHATSQIAQTTLRSVIGQYELDDVLAQQQRGRGATDPQRPAGSTGRSRQGTLRHP